MVANQHKGQDETLLNAFNWKERSAINQIILKPVYWLFPLLVWSVIVLISYQHNVRQIEAHTENNAINKGRFIFTMVENMRLWNARHGGVYVYTSHQTPSNPYLDDPKKDIVTTDGKQLTKINPAYMTRQISGLIQEESDMLVHLTSLQPINPNNLADNWERQALNSFEAQNRESYDFLQIGLMKQFRYMAPLVIEKSCLACHASQGYKLGDIRGGLSVSFNATAFLEQRDQQIKTQLYVHVIAWVLLCSMTVFAMAGLRKQLLLLVSAHREQESIVAVRTRDLREESRKRHAAQAQFRRFIDASAEGIIAFDQNAICSFANPKAAKLLLLDSPEELIGQDFHTLSGHHLRRGRPLAREDCQVVQCMKNGKELYSDDELFRKSNGMSFPVEFFVSPVFDGEQCIGAIMTFVDVSARKARESELMKLSTAVSQSPATTIITDRTGRIEYVNQRFVDVTGYTEEEAIGQNPRLLKSGHTPLEVYKNMWETLFKGESWKGELLNRKKDGTLFWEEALISPIKNEYDEVTHFVAVKRDITKYKLELDEVWRQANYDALTNLPNRNLFEDRLENAVALNEREGRMLALLFIDLDGFKQINDGFGHEVGDHVLITTAQRLQKCLRHSDTAARLGGDEFVIILQNVHDVEDVENVARKIIHEVSLDISHKDEYIQVQASIGISIMPRDASSANDLLRFSDVAMYGAKQRGKNRFCHYDSLELATPDAPSGS